MAFRDRHADGVGKSLAEGAGGGLDARRVAVFRMAGGDRAELAKALDLLDRHALVADEMEQRIDQHRAVPGREDEAVAVGPLRIRGVVLQHLPVEQVRERCERHRGARVAGVRLLDRIHGERPDRVDRKLFDVLSH